MLALAIHTSSPELGLALLTANQQKHQVWPVGRDLTAHLHTCLLTFLAGHCWSELTFLAVAVGPGGFTGTRIGVVAARTLAQQLEIPLFGVSSLAAIAQQQLSLQPSSEAEPAPLLAVQMAAQRQEWFGAVYQVTPAGLTLLQPAAVFSAEHWQQILETLPAPYRLITADGGLADTAPAILTLAQHQWAAGLRPHWSEVLPFYGQHPVA